LFITARDGVLLHYVRWPTEPIPAVAAVVFVHGIASHAGWFSETASFLRQRGVAVYAPDRRGSGISGGWPGHLDRFEHALDDLDQVTALVASERPGLPIFLAASSWSAKLALLYVERAVVPLSGLLLLGPGLLPTVGLSARRRLAVVGRHFVTPRAAVRIPLTPEMYTANPVYVELIRIDPLRLINVTAQFFWETARLDRHRARAARRLRLPLLVLQGERDAMMNVAATRRWFTRLPLADKTYRAYRDAGHTLDFEPDPSRYRDDMLDWLRRRAHRHAEGRDGQGGGVGCPA
jgi:alpha-beta hydrolase superfamily lysophospholipase